MNPVFATEEIITDVPIETLVEIPVEAPVDMPVDETPVNNEGVIHLSFQSENLTVTEGVAGNILSVEATTTNGESLSYEWKNTNEVLLDNGNESTYIIPSTLVPGVYFFYCELSAPNCLPLNSGPIQVTVLEAEIEEHVHDLSGVYHTDDNEHWKVCYCGFITEPEPHTPGDWEVTQEPTVTEDGFRQKTCTACDWITHQELIPAIVEITTEEDLRRALESTTPATIYVNESLTLTDLVSLGSSHTLALASSVTLSLDNNNRTNTIHIPKDKELILKGLGTLDLQSRTGPAMVVEGVFTLEADAHIVVRGTSDMTLAINDGGRFKSSGFVQVQNTRGMGIWMYHEGGLVFEGGLLEITNSGGSGIDAFCLDITATDVQVASSGGTGILAHYITIEDTDFTISNSDGVGVKASPGINSYCNIKNSLVSIQSSGTGLILGSSSTLIDSELLIHNPAGTGLSIHNNMEVDNSQITILAEEEESIGALFYGQVLSNSTTDIYLQEGASLATNYVTFNDRSFGLQTRDIVSVEEDGNNARTDGLSTGTYTWDEGLFVKEGLGGIDFASWDYELVPGEPCEITYNLQGIGDFDSEVDLETSCLECVVDGATITLCENHEVGDEYELTLQSTAYPGIYATETFQVKELHSHDFGEDWCGDASYHWKECDCGLISSKEEHEKSDWIEEEGFRYNKCNICDQRLDYEELATSDYEVLSHFGTWSGSGNLSAKIAASPNDFARLLLGEDEVQEAAYTLEETYILRNNQSTITLKESYLKTLDPGTYAFVADYLQGESEPITLTILEEDEGEDGKGEETPGGENTEDGKGEGENTEDSKEEKEEEKDETKPDTTKPEDSNSTDTDTKKTGTTSSTSANSDKGPTSPKTGDMSLALFYLLLLALSTNVLLYKRRK